MFKNEKAARHSGSNEKLIKRDGFNNGFSVMNCNRFGFTNQCRICHSDYMKFATPDGVCLDCQQRTEYVIREHPHVVAKAQNKGVVNAR